jgi:hypothetical protein
MAYASDGTPIEGWIGVDLDGTLAEYHGWGGPEEIGVPVPKMLARVKAWIDQGREVRIMTARASVLDEPTRILAVAAVKRWCLEHVGVILPVTHEKDLEMAELWDDRAITVEINTGEVICHPAGAWTP